MMKMKKVACLAMVFTLLITNAVFAATDDYEKNEIDVVEDKIITKEEYIEAVAEYKNLTYSEAEQEMKNEIAIARVPAESVVTISRSVTKTVNSDFKLRCTAYLQVVRDNSTNKYIEITKVLSPYVDLEGPSIRSTMSGNPEAEWSGKKATVYCNGTITYTAPQTTVSINYPGVSIGTNVSGDTNYRYNVSKTFVFSI